MYMYGGKENQTYQASSFEMYFVCSDLGPYVNNNIVCARHLLQLFIIKMKSFLDDSQS